MINIYYSSFYKNKIKSLNDEDAESFERDCSFANLILKNVTVAKTTLSGQNSARLLKSPFLGAMFHSYESYGCCMIEGVKTALEFLSSRQAELEKLPRSAENNKEAREINLIKNLLNKEFCEETEM